MIQRTIGVTSGKGGVGKSSVTVNLAATLAKRGHRVGILDADVYGFSIPRMLGVVQEPELDGERIVPPSANGVSCISIGFFVEEKKPVMWRGPMLHKALEQFLNDVQWGDLDFLLVDMPPGTGDVAMSLAKLITTAEILVVTTPQLSAHEVAQRSGAMAREVGMAVRGVIENMSWFDSGDGVRRELFGAGGGKELAAELGTSLLGQIPLDPALREGADAGVPIVVAQPNSEIARVFDDMAEVIEGAAPRRVFRDELKVT